jgi:DNA repair protein RecN (Recombination protein N)
MLKSLGLRDFVIVDALDVNLSGGFTVLTGETGAGKSILIDALQLALGNRADAGVVREGCSRAEVSATFDSTPGATGWLEEHGFAADDGDGTLLIRRVVDSAGKSRAWINGSSATVTQLRELADHLVDIHGQHAWQGLTRPSAVRALIDELAGSDMSSLTAAWDRWRDAEAALQAAEERRSELEQQREQLSWELKALDRLAPGAGEWDDLVAEHQRLAHSQTLIEGARLALSHLDDDGAAHAHARRGLAALEAVLDHDARLQPIAEVLRSAEAQLQDAARSLSGYLSHAEVDPQRLQELDARMADWMSAARRHRTAPADLPRWHADARVRLDSLEAAVDADALARTAAEARAAYREAAGRVSEARRALAPRLAAAVTAALQTLGMQGAQFEVALPATPEPQRHGLESVELLVAGHAGSSPRPLGKVASGGELSRIALAIAVTTRAGGLPASQRHGAASAEPMTLVFDEVDSGIGGAVADTVGKLLKRLGGTRQVLAVTHLAQVAACADQHFVVSKSQHSGRTVSRLQLVEADTRVQEVARMLGGEHLSGTSLAHAAELLSFAALPQPEPPMSAPASAPRGARPTARSRSQA